MKISFFKKIATIAMAGIITTGVSLASTKTVSAAEPVGKITVSGEGSVTLKPDIAYISVGVSTTEKEPQDAQKNNDVRMNQLIKTLKDAGIAEKDIQTTNYSIYPERDYNNGNRITGYVVNNNVTVTIRDLDNVGTILGECISAGANTGTGIQFSVEDPSQAYEKALAIAINNARTKGSAMANAMGVQLGAALEVRETGRVYVRPMAEMAISYDKGMAGGAPVESGSLVITASVESVFGY